MLKIDQSLQLAFKKNGHVVPKTSLEDVENFLKRNKPETKVIAREIKKDPVSGELLDYPYALAEHPSPIDIKIKDFNDPITILKEVNQETNNYVANLKKELFISKEPESMLAKWVFGQQVNQKMLNRDISVLTYPQEAIEALNASYTSGHYTGDSTYQLDLFKKLVEIFISKRSTHNPVIAGKLFVLASSRGLDDPWRTILDNAIVGSPHKISLDMDSLLYMNPGNPVYGATAFSKGVKEHFKNFPDKHKIFIENSNKDYLEGDDGSIRSEVYARSMDYLIHKLGISIKFSQNFIDTFLNIETILPEKSPLEKLLKRYYLCQPLVNNTQLKEIVSDVITKLAKTHPEALYDQLTGMSALCGFLLNGHAAEWEPNKKIQGVLPKNLSVIETANSYYMRRDLDESNLADFLQDNSQVRLNFLAAKKEIDANRKYYGDFSGESKNLEYAERWLRASHDEDQKISQLFNTIWQASFGENYLTSCDRIRHDEEKEIDLSY